MKQISRNNVQYFLNQNKLKNELKLDAKTKMTHSDDLQIIGFIVEKFNVQEIELMIENLKREIKGISLDVNNAIAIIVAILTTFNIFSIILIDEKTNSIKLMAFVALIIVFILIARVYFKWSKSCDNANRMISYLKVAKIVKEETVDKK